MRVQVNFNLKRASSAAATAVIAVVRFEGKTVKLATGISIEPKNWNPTKQRAKTGIANERNVNAVLAKIVADVEKVFAQFDANEEQPTEALFRDRYDILRGKVAKVDGAKPKTLLGYYDDYKAEAKSRLKPASLQIHTTVIAHIKGFQKAYSVKVGYDRIDVLLFDKFFAYLVNVAGVNNVTAWKILKTFKAFLRWSYERGYTTSTEFTKFTSKRIPKGDKTSKVYLTPSELQSVIDLDLTDSPRLDRVRDLFVLQANTGVRFMDLQALRIEHIQGDEITFITGKNRKAIRIPILPEARRILEKYNYELPKISTQKQNDYLREVMQKAGLDTAVVVVDFKGAKRVEKTVAKWELVSTHGAKRTFVTILRQYGVSIESIMRITGNCRSTIESYIVSTNDDALNEVRGVFASL